MELPDTHYARTADGAYLAYQVVGDGPVDIAWQFDGPGQLDVWWEQAWDSAWFEGLASFARLILHDRRGTGLSSRNVAVANLETRADDLRVVLDAVGSQSAVLGAWFESLAPCVLLAASHPARVRALVWSNPAPRTVWAPDYPWGRRPEDVALELEGLKDWGTIRYARAWADEYAAVHGQHPPEDAVRWMTKLTRGACTPDVAAEIYRVWHQTDIRGLLPSVQAPTLLLVGEGEGVNPAIAQHVASLIPDASVMLLPRAEWPIGRDEIERVNRPRLEAIQRFVGIEPRRASIETVLSTVLFTDVVGSTERQARLGDRAWKDVIERHHAIVRESLSAWRGIENDTAGDGFYVTFDGPARAIHCALEVRDRVRALGIEVRAGVHTGECELVDGKPGGIAVTIGARIAALAAASQVLVSRTVRDLVAGSGLEFEPAGEHELKGVPDLWRLYAAGERAGAREPPPVV
jgi:class 3 adenylate cyclase/pimeloyl-ACP methyl ester carboxylesterase